MRQCLLLTQSGSREIKFAVTHTLDQSALTVVFSDCPSSTRQISPPNLNRLIFKWRGKGVVPSVAKTEQRDHANDLDDLLFRPVFAQRDKHFIGNRIGHRGSRNSKIERHALGGTIQRACRVFPHRGELLVLNAEVKRSSGGVSHAILAP